MSEPTKAVFLSYASQDAEAAKRICDALRAAGVEVWFDQSELVGGDAWDQKIRKQIKDCALLIPIISAATQARTEGYFRLEWRLADQRTHLMAKGRPFLLPVVIDDTHDADAQVPDSFTEVQWTRLPGGETSPAFAARVKKLLSGEQGASFAKAPADKGVEASPNKSTRIWLVPVLIGLVAAGAFILWQPWRQRETAAPAPPAVPPSANGTTEIELLRARLRPDKWQAGDFEAMAPALDRLTRAVPGDAEGWALLSIINSLQVTRNLDSGTRPLEEGKAAAQRALRLAPDSPLAELAFGMHLIAMISRGGDVRASRPHIERGVAGLPRDALTRYAELASFWLGYQIADTQRCARAWLADEPHASLPAWILAESSLAARQPAQAEKWAELAAADDDITGVRAKVTLFEVRYYLQADLPAARAALDRIPSSLQTVHRVVFSRWLVAMAERHWDQALQELVRVPEPILFDRNFHGPKALLMGMAHQAAGRAEAAVNQFHESERLLREELSRDPENEELRAMLALSLAAAGKTAEAQGELAAVEPLLFGREPSHYTAHETALIGQTYGLLGDMEKLTRSLRWLFTEPSVIPLTPAIVRLDPRFSRFVSEPQVQALLKEFAGLDQPMTAPSSLSLSSSALAVADSKSVAVLAFTNLSDDKNNEYFSDGITEELLNVLAKIPDLKVSARTSAFYFKGKEVPIPEIAKQLGVAYVVEGSVRKSGDKVRITAQLIKAADGFHVWSDTFTRELKDIFAVQDEIAGLIAKNLELKLGDAPPAAKEVNPEAHQLYLQGKYFVNQFSYESATQAVALLQHAVELDPDFALAWVALSEAGSVQGGYATRLRDVEDGYALAGQAADKALALNPDLAAAHLARADVLAGHVFNWKGAQESLHRAQQLAPGDAAVIDGSARFAYYLGQKEQAVELGRQAVALDPVNPKVRMIHAFALTSVRRFPESDAEFRRIAELNPAAPWGHSGLSLNLSLQGRFAEAEAEAAQERNEWSRLLALALAQWGQKKPAVADATLAQLVKSYGDTAAYQIAETYTFRHDSDQAFAWLERAYRQRDSGLAWIKSDPFFEGLAGDPRWEQFLHKLGLSDAQLK